jgi:hypothetical protein
VATTLPLLAAAVRMSLIKMHVRIYKKLKAKRAANKLKAICKKLLLTAD